MDSLLHNLTPPDYTYSYNYVYTCLIAKIYGMVLEVYKSTVASPWVLYHNSLNFTTLGAYPVYWVLTMCQIMHKISGRSPFVQPKQAPGRLHGSGRLPGTLR